MSLDTLAASQLDSTPGHSIVIHHHAESAYLPYALATIAGQASLKGRTNVTRIHVSLERNLRCRSAPVMARPLGGRPRGAAGRAHT